MLAWRAMLYNTCMYMYILDCVVSWIGNKAHWKSIIEACTDRVPFIENVLNIEDCKHWPTRVNNFDNHLTWDLEIRAKTNCYWILFSLNFWQTRYLGRESVLLVFIKFFDVFVTERNVGANTFVFMSSSDFYNFCLDITSVSLHHVRLFHKALCNLAF